MSSSSNQENNDVRDNPVEGEVARSDANLLPNFLELNEVNLPPPDENPDERPYYWHHTLEEGPSTHLETELLPAIDPIDREAVVRYENLPSDFANITEIAAPPPDENPDDRPLGQCHTLEGETTSKRVSVSVPQTTHDGKGALFKLLYTVSYLIIFSILGTIARLSLQAATQYPNAPVIFTELWSNVGGSFLIGLLQEERWLFSAHHKTSNERNSSEALEPENENELDFQKEAAQRASLLKFKKGLPLYIGMTVGFCGSFTTFSSFIRDAFLALSNDLIPYGSSDPAARNPGWSVFAVLAVIITEAGLCLSALSAGSHAAIWLNHHISWVPTHVIEKSENLLVPVFAIALWGGTAVITGWPPHGHEIWRGKALFALVFAPIGCLLRFQLSIRLNGLVPKFPLGTFTSNIFGTFILGMCWDLQHAQLDMGDKVVGIVSCQVLQGVQDGFCGCLTTVSTLVAELKGLQKKHAYSYGFWSVSLALIGITVIVGPLKWMGMLENASCT
jgi:fluoride ion exporter CrcB/FEX